PANGGSREVPGPRRSSFNFLRRQKSGEKPQPAQRSVSGGKMNKKQKAQMQEELLRQQREAAAVPKQPPRLPSHAPLPTINTFGGENARQDSYAIMSNKAQQAGNFSRPSGDYRATSASPPHVPIPPIPGSSPYGRNGDFDPYARTESMTHRGRYSYASSAVSTINSPRRVRRRKDPTPFNILVIGTKSCGKTSFINFLQTALKLPARKQQQQSPSPPRTALPVDSPFTSQYLETEMDNERIGVTLWDSRGLERNIVDLQLKEMATFLESKFEETFNEEQRIVRAPGVRDTHIHCVFLILDPSRLDANIAAATVANDASAKSFNSARVIGGLDEDLDLQVLRTLQGKTTVIPVISKADTITTAHMAFLKKKVWDSLKQSKLDPLEALDLGDSDDEDIDRLDERDEDEYNHSSDNDDKHSDILNNLIDRSSSDEEGEDSSNTSFHGSTPAKSPADPSKRPVEGHRRRVSAMSASINHDSSRDELPYLPLSILSPDMYEPNVIGRRFPWGFADPYNVEHCDFVRLKESVFVEWRAELREASRECWYEGWRTSRLNRRTDQPSRAHTSSGLSPNPSPVNGMGNGRAVTS
ncbi:hypothetical protein M501DRAFT_919044, partial [Patellaria atrata CBS 101060]